MSARIRRSLPGMHGILLVDKPQNHTSHDVVARVRKAAGFARCGHAGTLDPMATGVLPVLLGDATRLSEWLMDHDKEYEFTVCFGRTTDTYDAWGRTLAEQPVPPMDEQDVAALAARFTGPQMQVPPMYSALKVNGKKLHDEARRGHEVPRAARPVTIHAMEVIEWAPPCLRLRVACSKGTYVRTLAHDMGQAAGCGACITELRRVRVGHFHVQDASKLEDVLSADEIARRLISLPDALPQFARIPIDAESAARIADGCAIAPAIGNSFLKEGEPVFLMDDDGRALALAEYQKDWLRPLRVFAGALSENKMQKDTCNFAGLHQNPFSGG